MIFFFEQTFRAPPGSERSLLFEEKFLVNIAKGQASRGSFPLVAGRDLTQLSLESFVAETLRHESCLMRAIEDCPFQLTKFIR